MNKLCAPSRKKRSRKKATNPRSQTSASAAECGHSKPGAAQAGFACAGFDFPSGAPTSHYTNYLELPDKQAGSRRPSKRATNIDPESARV